MIDEKLRQRHDDENADAEGGKDDARRQRQPRLEPAAEQRPVGDIAETRGGDADRQPDGELEMPEGGAERRKRQAGPEQAEPERIDGARSHAVEQAADERAGRVHFCSSQEWRALVRRWSIAAPTSPFTRRVILDHIHCARCVTRAWSRCCCASSSRYSGALSFCAAP